MTHRNKNACLSTGVINSHRTIYYENEQGMLDNEGNMKDKADRVSIIIEEIDENKMKEASAVIGKVETNFTAKNLSGESLNTNRINNFTNKIKLDGAISKFKISIGYFIKHELEHLDRKLIGADPTEEITYV